jgi:hypothetical protein
MTQKPIDPAADADFNLVVPNDERGLRGAVDAEIDLELHGPGHERGFRPRFPERLPVRAVTGGGPLQPLAFQPPEHFGRRAGDPGGVLLDGSPQLVNEFVG